MEKQNNIEPFVPPDITPREEEQNIQSIQADVQAQQQAKLQAQQAEEAERQKLKSDFEYLSDYLYKKPERDEEKEKSLRKQQGLQTLVSTFGVLLDGLTLLPETKRGASGIVNKRDGNKYLDQIEADRRLMNEQFELDEKEYKTKREQLAFYLHKRNGDMKAAKAAMEAQLVEKESARQHQINLQKQKEAAAWERTFATNQSREKAASIRASGNKKDKEKAPFYIDPNGKEYTEQEAYLLANKASINPYNLYKDANKEERKTSISRLDLTNQLNDYVRQQNTKQATGMNGDYNPAKVGQNNFNNYNKLVGGTATGRKLGLQGVSQPASVPQPTTGKKLRLK